MHHLRRDIRSAAGHQVQLVNVTAILLQHRVLIVIVVVSSGRDPRPRSAPADYVISSNVLCQESATVHLDKTDRQTNNTIFQTRLDVISPNKSAPISPAFDRRVRRPCEPDLDLPPAHRSRPDSGSTVEPSRHGTRRRGPPRVPIIHALLAPSVTSPLASTDTAAHMYRVGCRLSLSLPRRLQQSHIPAIRQYYQNSSYIYNLYRLPRSFRPFSIMPSKAAKRKAEPTDDAPVKKPNRGSPSSSSHHAATADGDDAIVREYYPPEMTNERVQSYRDGTIPTPYEELTRALEDAASAQGDIKPGKAVAHWFRWDLRLHDNTGLHKAHRSAKAKGLPLVCLYVFSHEDFKAHCTSPARIDLALRTLKILKDDLAKLNIPLWVEEVKDRKQTVDTILNWCREWHINEMHANMEYEVDELRRDAKLVKAGTKKDLAFHVYHDTCVVEPMTLRSGAGKPYAVFTPFFKAWEPYVWRKKILDNLSPPPEKNSDSEIENLKELFSQKDFPSPDDEKRLSKEDVRRLAKLWPAGEHEAKDRLKLFLDERVAQYADRRDRPDLAEGTSALSLHFACGTLSARQAVRAARDHNKGNSLDKGHYGWIREVCFRDFYKNILAVHPHVCMSKAYHEDYHKVQWEYNEEHFQRWTAGKTGYPIVDAAMRQLMSDKFVHNRCRMIVASFLCKHLLLDWRKGERFFMEHLIDGDFASNNAGWQSEKHDPNGDYIRRWLPELRDVKGNAVHDPHGRLPAKEFQKLGYPEPIVEHKFARERALERYKSGLGKNTR
ncbi:Deoxyribodipyrimidine photo-lyase [Drechslerella dactyloides]|uniref:Deoxyribodipyrimidine photo-lyase n=1 Tax=Drechslerella dactyloides TaxID=74499 RepID=A0AAD6NJM3_DREDA|nr:Deoxyribodipyrimidine photo-lyase [Drechslerella dactyloides]